MRLSSLPPSWPCSLDSHSAPSWPMVTRTITIAIINTSIIIIITRPKPAYGRQGLAGSWGQDTDKVSTFWVFLTSHFAPAALSSELNQPGTIHDDTNPPGIMKTRPGAIKKHEKPPGTMKYRPVTIKPTWSHEKPLKPT